MPLCCLIPPQASCDLFFLDLKRGASVVRASLKSVKSEIVVRPMFSSLSLIEAWSGSVVPPWSGLLPLGD